MIDLKTKDILRRYRFNPYYDSTKPSFSLTTWDTYICGDGGRSVIGYQFTMHTFDLLKPTKKKKSIVIFEGEDFATHDVINSDRVAQSILGFLTLRLGDTDKEYFDNYTEIQKDFRDFHAEMMAVFMYDRFGEDN